jgi:hypothetical protein
MVAVAVKNRGVAGGRCRALAANQNIDKSARIYVLKYYVDVSPKAVNPKLDAQPLEP